MSEQHPHKEFRIKRGDHILGYIKKFSATEKAVFGIFIIIAFITSLILATEANGYFMVEIPARGGELREGIIGLPQMINPVLASSDSDRDLSTLVYSGLMKYENGVVIPDIASSYTISNDGLTYSVSLRNNVVFQDGIKLTADDVIFTIQKIQNPLLKSPRHADWANVTAKKVSDYEVQFILKQPYGPFLTNMTIGIIPKHIWEKFSDDQFIFSQYNIQPIGSGPYKVDSISRDSSQIPTDYHLTTWKKYYGKVPFISSLVFHFFTDEDKAIAGIDSDIVDSVPSISPKDATQLASNSGEAYQITSSPLPRLFGVFFNQNQNPVFTDKNVRLALNMSVDRNEIVKTVLSGYGTPTSSPLPIGLATTSIKTDINIAGARALLEKGGWTKNANGIYEKKDKKSTQTLSFDIYTADTPDLKKTADLIKATWTTLGANVNIKVFEPNDLYQNVIRTRKYDALLFGELIGKDRDLYAFWHSSQRNAPGLNIALYTNTVVDKLLEDMRSTSDDRVKITKYMLFENIVRSEAPAVFLYVPDFIYAIPKDLRGAKLGTLGTVSDRFNTIEDWYIKTDRVWKAFVNK